MTTQQSVMNSLFTAFAGFTAFGAAIVAILAGGGVLQNIANRWVQHAQDEHPGDQWAWLRNPIVIMPSAILICLVVLGSGTGLMLSFLWLHTEGSDGWGWTYGVSEALFWCEVVGVTVITAMAVGTTGWSSVSAAKSARSGQVQPIDNPRTDQYGQPTSLRAVDECLLPSGCRSSDLRVIRRIWWVWWLRRGRLGASSA
jgi:hypothetical protein